MAQARCAWGRRGRGRGGRSQRGAIGWQGRRTLVHTAAGAVPDEHAPPMPPVDQRRLLQVAVRKCAPPIAGADDLSGLRPRRRQAREHEQRRAHRLRGGSVMTGRGGGAKVAQRCRVVITRHPLSSVETTRGAVVHHVTHRRSGRQAVGGSTSSHPIKNAHLRWLRGQPPRRWSARVVGHRWRDMQLSGR